MGRLKSEHSPTGFVNIPDPTPQQVSIEDIAHSLSGQCRFNGWTSSFFSVAQHSVEVSILCSKAAVHFGVDTYEAAFAGLLHDAHEAYVGDVASPIRRRLGDAWWNVERAAELSVHDALGITDIMTRCAEVVRWADVEMLMSDMARFGPIGSPESPTQAALPHVVERGRVPPPHELRFSTAIPLDPIPARYAFITSYRGLRAKLDARS